MNRFFVSTLIAALPFLTNCHETPPDAALDRATANIIKGDYENNETPSENQLSERSLSGFFPPMSPSLGINRGGGGYARRTLQKEQQTACSQVKGNACSTGAIAPFDQGQIFCEQNEPVCRPLINELQYYLYIEDFIKSFIEIPTSNVLVDSTTTSSRYLAGRAPVYNELDQKVGTCSASFLCMQNQDNIYTDISNYLSVNNGLIISWFTPTTLINLELDSIVNSMVTECIVLASTKVLLNPFYGSWFDMVVSSDGQKIHFTLTRIIEEE